MLMSMGMPRNVRMARMRVLEPVLVFVRRNFDNGYFLLLFNGRSGW
jgi:hypothetical protein